MFGYFIKGKPQSFKFRFIDFSILKNFIAGCKQLVAGKAHNLEVAGSSPAPATKDYIEINKKRIFSWYSIWSFFKFVRITPDVRNQRTFT